MNVAEFDANCRFLGLDLPPEQLLAFERFEEALYLANESMNLTRIPKEEAWRKHFLDSLLFHDLIPSGASVLDIGTGPGFPAWPLACARPDLRIVALDSSGKMLGFLRQHVLPNLSPVLARAEEWDPPAQFEVVTGRAVAPLAVQLELSAHFCANGGLVIPMRTPAEEAQILRDVSQLGLKLEARHERELPGTDIRRLFPIYRKIERGRTRRTWADMKRNPLF